jgi:hypothetical protein
MFRTHFLEIAFGTMAVGGLSLLIVIGRYLMGSAGTPRGREVARSICVFDLGFVMLCLWWWLRFHLRNDGYDIAWMDHHPVGVVVGLTVAMIGIFCMVRVFSLSRAPAWIWLGVVGGTVAVMTAVSLAR